MSNIQFDINKFKDAKIVVYGDMMVDEYLSGDVSRISPEAPVPVVCIKNETKRLGGAGNVVRNLCALGADVIPISCIGKDESGEWLVNRFTEYGLDISGLLQNDRVVTSIKTRVTSQNQQLLRYDREIIQDVPSDFTDWLKDNVLKYISKANAVIISDYGKGAVTKTSAQILIEAANELDIPVVIDPKGSDYSKYSGATVCTPNMKEIQAAVNRSVSSEKEIANAARELCEDCNIKYILATRSEKGMSLIEGATGKKLDYPALAKEVIDVTGAGDTVISAFTLCYALGANFDDCCKIANMAASIVVSKFGASVVYPEEIQELIVGNSYQNTKLLTLEQAKKKAVFLRQQGKKIVFTNGCFDIVHAGHIASFKQARSFGDVLFVGVNSDSSIKRIKGANRPVVDESNRVKLLEAVNCIDYLILFEEDTPQKLIENIIPAVLVKGKDWAGQEVAGGKFVEQNGGKVCFIDLEQGLSTTNIVNKILETNRK